MRKNFESFGILANSETYPFKSRDMYYNLAATIVEYLPTYRQEWKNIVSQKKKFLNLNTWYIFYFKFNN